MNQEDKANSTKILQIFNNIKERLRFNQIFKENYLISGLNSHLQFKLDHFLRWDVFRSLNREEVMGMILKLSFLKVGVAVHEGREVEVIRLQYEHSQRTVLVAGVYKQQIEKLVDKFCQNYFKYQGQFAKKTPPATVLGYNGFWVTIQAINEEMANQLTMFLRAKKKGMEGSSQINKFKIQNRRIRIILLSEDLFSLFIDSMADHKAEQFARMMRNGGEVEKRRMDSRPVLEMAKNGINYRPMPIARNSNYENSFNQQKCNYAFYEGIFTLNNFKNTTSSLPKKEPFFKKDQGIQTDFIQQKQHDNISQLSSQKYGESVYTLAETEKQSWKMRDECLKDQQSFNILQKDQNSTLKDHGYSMSENQDGDKISVSSNNSDEHNKIQPNICEQQRCCSLTSLQIV